MSGGVVDCCVLVDVCKLSMCISACVVGVVVGGGDGALLLPLLS